LTTSEVGGTSLASVARPALLLAGAAVAAQVIGLVRELYLAARVGISIELDALLIGLVLPAILSNILTSGVATALVPAYLDVRRTRGPDDARRLAGTVLVWVAAAGLVAWIALDILASGIVAATGPGLTAAGRESAAGYLRLLAPTAFAVSISGVLYAVCQAEEAFSWIALSTLAGSAFILGTMLILWDSLGVKAFAVGNLAGPIATAVVLLVATIRRSIVPRPRIVARGYGLGAFARHALPLSLSSAILQLNTVFDRAIATLVAPGAVSALRYGDTLVRTPISAISPAFSSAVYPTLVQAAQGSETSALAFVTAQILRYVIAVFVPVSALTLAVAPVAASVLYGRGAFTAADVSTTAQVVGAFAPLLVIFLSSQILTQALNARRRGRLLLAAGIINVISNCVLDVVFGFSLGVSGIALSSSVTAAIVVVFKARRLAGSEAAFRLRPLARNALLAFLAVAPGALVCGALSWAGLFPPGTIAGVATLAAFGGFGMGTYLVLATRLGLNEPRILLTLGLARLTRGRSIRRPAK
jgi:putative peptidoglycan lipid II flippase